MGLWDKVKGEFIDIIEWKDDSRDTLVWRFPRYQDEIKNNAQLTVRESQLAVFVNEGEVADVYEPGRYELRTQNMPILTTLKSWKYGFDSPFKAEVYFINTRQFIDQKWGTSHPISIRDSEYGEVDIRAFGTYAYRVPPIGTFGPHGGYAERVSASQQGQAVVPAQTLIREIVGTHHDFDVDNINGQLRSILVSSFTDSVGEAQRGSNLSFLDMSSNLDELSAEVRKRIAQDFSAYGLELSKFLVENISVPEAIQEIRQQRMKMRMLGIQNYTQMQAADAMVAAAENPSGGNLAGAGVGIGAGYMMGQQMMQGMQPGQPGQPQYQSHQHHHQNQAPPAAAPPPAAPPPLPQVAYYAAIGGQQAGPFDMNGLQQQIGAGNITGETLVWKQGMSGWTKASEVQEVSQLFAAGPPPLPPPLPTS